MSLTLPELCSTLRISRSTAKRAMDDGLLKGTKVHSCGSPCGSPEVCRHGDAHWEFSDEQVQAFLAASAVRKESHGDA
ncbi:hypothetical protein [Planomonospora venezuelensis]|uniref:Helix-turn-helix domain-containing protein n=1 Tax=Planomonospora venezuelensis TaxID=1999 RepID=A0A841D5E5_PLAVE|nr:hypothetical protein [Planomonospora venezuelensis]MBB5965090.1 hypothetical protein [Planomonospora venezuelensis]GIN04992.1 hypothetical protein Pve01_66500 [Planomonospora venezuelensis]